MLKSIVKPKLAARVSTAILKIGKGKVRPRKGHGDPEEE
jgi:hypothetical protein